MHSKIKYGSFLIVNGDKKKFLKVKSKSPPSMETVMKLPHD